MSVLVTGAAGFIGFHVTRALLARGERVVGLDNLNGYYSVALKNARLAELEGEAGFTFLHQSLEDYGAMSALAQHHGDIDRIVHLAAQAGVRYSLDHPLVYGESNLIGHLNVLELARSLPDLRHLVYASSSSVYGGNRKLPFAVEDRVDDPISLYAATKRAGELMSQSYAHLYGIPQTGLRFFTVYGPWGRPDMAAWKFVEAVLRGETIELYNHGDMKRDFTFIDDIVAGTLAALDRPPSGGDEGEGEGEGEGAPPHRIYNLGNHRAEKLTDFVAVIEKACGQEAKTVLRALQPGDVLETYADIENARRDLRFEPSTPIEVGIPRFVEWFRGYANL